MKKSVLASLCLVPFILSGCMQQPLRLTPGAENIRIGKNDPEQSYQYVGEITSVDGNGCGLYGSRGTYQAAVVKLRNKAYSMGANYVQITNQTAPRMEGNCFFNEYQIDGTAYRLPNMVNSQTNNSYQSNTNTSYQGNTNTSYQGNTTNSYQGNSYNSNQTQGVSKERQLQELRQQDLPYAEYQRRYQEIMGN